MPLATLEVVPADPITALPAPRVPLAALPVIDRLAELGAALIEPLVVVAWRGVVVDGELLDAKGRPKKEGLLLPLVGLTGAVVPAPVAAVVDGPAFLRTSIAEEEMAVPPAAPLPLTMLLPAGPPVL